MTFNRLIESLVREAVLLRKRVIESLSTGSKAHAFRKLHSDTKKSGIHNLDQQQFADAYIQTIVCVYILKQHGNLRRLPQDKWLTKYHPFLVQLFDVGILRDIEKDLSNIFLSDHALREAINIALQKELELDPFSFFYERFLQEYNARSRKERGMFYTPRVIVSFIVDSIDEMLRREFGLTAGLADTTSWQEMHLMHPHLQIPQGISGETPFVQILDPATGTGIFLSEVINKIHQTMTTQWKSEGRERSEINQLWNQYVPRHLLPRVHGIELMIAPFALAHLHIAETLADTGYDFSKDYRLNLYCSNSLNWDGTRKILTEAFPRTLSQEAHKADTLKTKTPITVILGNPPFSGISANKNCSAERLLRGNSSVDQAKKSYYQLNGKPLAEKKLWLKDDYVKFFRLGQWKIDSVGCGILGLISNHGYLDNPTFRGMRRHIIESFPRTSVIDLHGNLKKHELSPTSERDRNVFEIEQGIAIGLFRNLGPHDKNVEIKHSEIWGSRSTKFSSLKNITAYDLAETNLSPSPPFYFFYPRDETHTAEYEQGIPITEVMPINTSAVVTARDKFVVGFNEEELIERVNLLRDEKNSDAELRNNFFSSARSHKYPQGDTRGWKLPQARRTIQQDKDWQGRVLDCLYRPFDSRKIYWAPWMIDWPRQEIMHNFIGKKNLSILARRQMLPTQECNYFWVSDKIPIDGVIRSDNRGSESVFPLYLYPELENSCNNLPSELPILASEPMANFNDSFIKDASEYIGLSWKPFGSGDLVESYGPEDLLHFIYSQFFSRSYRTRYAVFLRTNFPHIFMTPHLDLFRSLCQIGRKLVSLHLLECEDECLHHDCSGMPVGNYLIESGYPKYDNGSVYINSTNHISDISPEVWKFKVGGHQVCRKWLKDRKGHILTSLELCKYEQIVKNIETTLQLMDAIEDSIQQHGGWPVAFQVQLQSI